jgi:hypothetical protein
MGLQLVNEKRPGAFKFCQPGAGEKEKEQYQSENQELSI